MTTTPRNRSDDGASADPAKAGTPLERWTRDWDRWRLSGPATAALQRWRQTHPLIADLATISDLLAGCGGDPAVPQELGDQRLAALVAEARAGDQAAARVVLQRVFPPLVHRCAARARRDHVRLGPLLDDVMAWAWLVIAQYPLSRRPVKIAVNIIRDAEHHAFGYTPVMLRRTVPVDPATLPYLFILQARRTRTPMEPEHVLGWIPRVLLDEMNAGFPPADARLLCQIYVFGLTTAEIAAAEHVHPHWIRKRRRRALTRLGLRLTPPAGRLTGSPASPGRWP